MLTNFSEIKKRINRLEALNNEMASGELERKYTKKERVLIGREMTKLEFNFGGIAAMTKSPDFVLVVDPRHDNIAVTEATVRRIPIIGIMSSDCDISKVAYPVVVNDSLQTSVSLVLEELAAAYKEGTAAFVPRPVAPRAVIDTRRPRA